VAKRKIQDKSFDLREWQQEACRGTMDNFTSGKNDFLCVATPGSGKTKYALKVAHEMLKKGYCKRVVVITPTDSLKRQWAATAAEYAGIDLDPDFTNAMGSEASDYHGIVTTYAALGMDKKKIHTQNTFNKPTFVIFDEVHHCGNKDHLTWGIALKEAFENAMFRLSISGTAFRSDDAEIPFVEYKDRVSVSNYNYSYDRAVQENVCRKVYFSTHDGDMKWKVASETFSHDFKDVLEPDQVSKRLRTALDPKGNYVQDIIKAADKKLDEIRKAGHPDAGGLIFGITQEHARQIAKVVEKVTGIMPPIIVSDEAQSNEILNTFKNDFSRWMVSVKMVSEGVDIPRLRVGVYFTNVKAELFFRQLVGRFVRVLSHLQWQDAFIFIPQDRDIVKLAESIQEERDHALEKCEKSTPDEDTDLFGNEYTPALQGKFVPLGSEATDVKEISVNVAISDGMKTGIDVRKVITDEDPVYLQKHELRAKINSLVKRYAHMVALRTGAKADYRAAHRIWAEQPTGKKIATETVDELKNHELFYRNLLQK